MPSPENARLAVLIDADNTSVKSAEALMEEVAKYGIPTVKRAYGDWTNSHLSGWLRAVSKYAIQPMLQIAHTTGKNSSDSALIIDAMDLLYSGNVDAFALVSSDSDFTSLAIRLRGSGRTVYGLGARKTPESLRQAVDRFIFLEDLHDAPDTSAEAADPVGVDAAEPTEQRRIPDLRRLLERAVNATADDDGWANLSSMRNQITRVEPSFSMKDYGTSKMADLVKAQTYLEVDQPGGGGPVRVRLRSGRATREASAEGTTTKKTATRKRAAAQPAAGDEPAAKKTAAKKTATSRTRTRRSDPPEDAVAAAASEPAAEPTAEPVAEPAAPTSSVTTRKRVRRADPPQDAPPPAAEPAAEPTTEPVAEPTTEPTTEPAAPTSSVTTRKRTTRKVQIT